MRTVIIVGNHDVEHVIAQHCNIDEEPYVIRHEPIDVPLEPLFAERIISLSEDKLNKNCTMQNKKTGWRHPYRYHR